MAAALPEVLLISSLIISLGIVAKVVADHYEVPSVVFLLGIGILFGPDGLGIIRPEIFGDEGLSAIVGISVAIIVFEGGFHLTLPKIRKSSGSTLKLVTLGALITWVGMGVVIHYLLGVAWSISFLISALLIATGPTVITPVMTHVNVREGVRGILESEGIINDVSAAILAVVMFEAVVLGDATGRSFLLEFISRLGTGILIGIVTAAVTWYILWIIGDSSQNSRLVVLGAAVASFAIAESLASETGIAAVAVAGVILGNLDLPYKEDIAEFKGDITIIVLSVIFILLAALLRIENVLALGVLGLAVVAILMFLVRPLAVFLSTLNSSFTMRERVFIAGVGPRGIVPASVATLFAIQLQNQPGIPTESANMVVSVVFIVILVTVVVQAGGAPFMSKKLDIVPMNVIVVGGGRIGSDIADTLSQRGENVVVIEIDGDRVDEINNEEYTVIHGNGTSSDVLQEAGIENSKFLVAATGNDDQNILACQTARTKFGMENVIGRVNNVENIDAFEDLGVRTVSPARATSFAVDNMIERPGLFSWISELGQGGDVIETDVTNEEVIGRRISELELPEGCIIALVQRDRTQFVPKEDVTLEKDDHVTLMGRAEDVRKATKLLQG